MKNLYAPLRLSRELETTRTPAARTVRADILRVGGSSTAVGLAQLERLPIQSNSTCPRRQLRATDGVRGRDRWMLAPLLPAFRSQPRTPTRACLISIHDCSLCETTRARHACMATSRCDRLDIGVWANASTRACRLSGDSLISRLPLLEPRRGWPLAGGCDQQTVLAGNLPASNSPNSPRPTSLNHAG